MYKAYRNNYSQCVSSYKLHNVCQLRFFGCVTFVSFICYLRVANWLCVIVIHGCHTVTLFIRQCAHNRKHRYSYKEQIVPTFDLCGGLSQLTGYSNSADALFTHRMQTSTLYYLTKHSSINHVQNYVQTCNGMLVYTNDICWSHSYKWGYPRVVWVGTHIQSHTLYTGLNLGLRQAIKRRRYFVTTFLIGRA